MAVSNKPVFPQAPKLGLASILPADTTTLKTLATAGANGAKVVGISVFSADSASRDIYLTLSRGGGDYPIASKAIPANSGLPSVAGVSLLDPARIPGLPVDADGQAYLYLQSGDVLKVNVSATLTAATYMNIFAVFADF